MHSITIHSPNAAKRSSISEIPIRNSWMPVTCAILCYILSESEALALDSVRLTSDVDIINRRMIMPAIGTTADAMVGGWPMEW